MSFTDKQARVAIANLVQTASGSSRVYSWNVLNFKVDPKTGRADFGDWVGLFSYTASNVDYTHGWVVRRVGRDTELSPECENPTFHYEILGFYAFDNGNETTNSDDAFAVIVEAVASAFNAGGNNGILTVNSIETYHNGLQFPVLTVLQSGEKLLHFAAGQLSITYTT